jgi:hypothetical protein
MGSEEVVRRITNSIRLDRSVSLRSIGEARTCEEQEAHGAEGLGDKATRGTVRWLETEGFEGWTREARRPARRKRKEDVGYRPPEWSRTGQASRLRAGVTALVVAMKPGNAGGAKGCRKVET